MCIFTLDVMHKVILINPFCYRRETIDLPDEEITAVNSLSPMLRSDHHPSTQSLGWHHFLNSPSISPSTGDVPSVYNYELDQDEQNKVLSPVKKPEQRLNAKQYPHSISDRDSQFHMVESSSIAISAPFSLDKDSVETSSNDISKTANIFDLDDSRDDDSTSYFTQEPTSNNVFSTHSTISDESLTESIYSTDRTCNIIGQRSKIGTSHDKVRVLFHCHVKMLLIKGRKLHVKMLA